MVKSASAAVPMQGNVLQQPETNEKERGEHTEWINSVKERGRRRAGMKEAVELEHFV